MCRKLPAFEIATDLIVLRYWLNSQIFEIILVATEITPRSRRFRAVRATSKGTVMVSGPAFIAAFQIEQQLLPPSLQVLQIRQAVGGLGLGGASLLLRDKFRCIHLLAEYLSSLCIILIR